MSGLVNELLSFSRAGLHPDRVPMETLDVAAVVHRVASRETFAGASIELEVQAGLSVMGNEALLLRALSNVLRNAVRYAGSAGAITVSAHGTGRGAEILVGDRGPRLPEGELEQSVRPVLPPGRSSHARDGRRGLGTGDREDLRGGVRRNSELPQPPRRRTRSGDAVWHGVTPQ